MSQKIVRPFIFKVSVFNTYRLLRPILTNNNYSHLKYIYQLPIN